MTPSIAETDAFAERCHAGQVDKAGRPYIQHPRTVAALLADHGDEAVMAGLLHDVVEDCGVTLDQLGEMGFSETVVSAVDSVSRRPGEPYMDMIQRAGAHPLGRLVKLADNATNPDEQRLALLDDDTANRLRRKYARARALLLLAEEVAR
jgi:(p)ppGpp synthase/HD superfamily hydrolase